MNENYHQLKTILTHSIFILFYTFQGHKEIQKVYQIRFFFSIFLWHTSINFLLTFEQFLSNSSGGIIIFWPGLEHATSMFEMSNVFFESYQNVCNYFFFLHSMPLGMTHSYVLKGQILLISGKRTYHSLSDVHFSELIIYCYY